MKRFLYHTAIFLLLSGGIFILDAQNRQAAIIDSIDGDALYRVLEPDAIPAIRHPQFLDVSNGNKQMAANEPVLGIIVGDEKRAYSLWQLDHHEIVNDEINGLPVAVTW